MVLSPLLPHSPWSLGLFLVSARPVVSTIFRKTSDGCCNLLPGSPSPPPPGVFVCSCVGAYLYALEDAMGFSPHLGPMAKCSPGPKGLCFFAENLLKWGGAWGRQQEEGLLMGQRMRENQGQRA